MNSIIHYFVEKLKEPSTWKGVIWIVTAFGLVLEPDQKEAIAAFGMTLAGLIGVFVEKGNAHTNEEIAEIVKEQHEKTVEKIIKEKKNAKNTKSNEKPNITDDFFNDGDGI